MPTFRRIKEVKSVLNEFPGIKTYKEFDILIEIGYHQEIGSPLTIKQLTLLDIASRATVRRHLNHLIEVGMVKKGASPKDQRSIVLNLSATTARMMLAHVEKILKCLDWMGSHPECDCDKRSGKA